MLLCQLVSPYLGESLALMSAQIVSLHIKNLRVASSQPEVAGEVSAQSLIKLSAAWE